MASAVAAKGGPLAGLEKLLAEPSAVPGTAYYARHPFFSVAAARLLRNSGGSPLGHDDEDSSSDSEDDVAVDDRRRKCDISKPVFFSSADLVDPAKTTLGRLLSKLEDAVKAEHVSMAAPRRGWWVARVKQDDDAVTLKVPMPGLGKEHVKMRAEQNVLLIKGDKETADDKGDKETADEDHKETADDKEKEEVPRYTYRIELPADALKMDQVRAEMKNGLLTVTVPKVKDEERKDVFHITVE
ncbi:hypothetical protein PR202_ga17720 [Eleusine coracana subsp. coracana]|uniref:SHSP domain-containing protein n=1 Tax=Eleusine coracana subsp. coracana TaxID=191504 RepID=A0AAV5CP00_ELECO|nr:hypothetical protein QOZ80_6AG0514050 [Eleusine coracana subsp. coracana]GJN00299.1 hypothetical protein PR202_ga17473 [Eleusine coracana subsp. coracana]GJN00531.1 hypothetical protein PR202_ga17720 [Eleusine coracana subsp. coracana]